LVGKWIEGKQHCTNMPTAQPISDTVRNSRPYQVLERSLENGRLAHAILLHGDDLDTVGSVAIGIASRLLKTSSPLEHPDCFTIRPTGKARMIRVGSKADRIQGEMPKQFMRRMISDIQKTSNQGGNKVAFVFEADRMNPNTANAFLKTLEEPPEGTTLFLLTSRPYDLLDTIRSRCLNFRIPSGLDALADTEWTDWETSYFQWLSNILSGPTKQTVPHIMLGAYGLNTRFQKILSDQTSEAWKAQKESLPDHITSEEKEAMEAGMSRGYRKQLYGQIEKATLRYAREIEKANPGRLPVPALTRVIETLEKSVGLLEINFNQTAALELFFLESMRIWATAK